MRELRLLLLAFFTVVAVIFSVSFVRERMDSDDRAPVIQADTDVLEVPLSATDEELLAGMTAHDNLDGDVTDTLVVVSRSKLIRPGTMLVNYAAFDKNNNVGTYSRQVTYSDYTAPRFHLTEPLRFLDGSSSYDFLEDVRAEDCLDGDITRQIKISTGSRRAVSDSVTEQTVNLQVTNSVGDTSELELVARIEDYSSFSRPVPALSEYVVYVQRGEQLDLESYLTGIWAGGKTRDFSETNYTADDVYIWAGELDLRTAGVYQVTYGFYNDSGETQLTVVVEE